ncbi:MAG: hypothetical protein JXB60_07250 [Candidatus Cloacimonetes bacterium]|nr:hypothetical protein [Candidatus Cloacimonadota bacterium]
MKTIKPKGIFCIEGLWHDDLRKKNTVKPILELLELNSQIPFIYEGCATVEELKFYLIKWIERKYKNYPILYLAFHGQENAILVSNESYTLNDMALLLANKCSKKIIVFASCSTVNIDKRKLKTFLVKTGALAICGYRLVVPWIESTAFELLLLESMQENVFDGRGVESIRAKAKKIARMFQELQFRMVTLKE